MGLEAVWGARKACKAITLLPGAIRTGRTPPTPAQALGDDAVLCLCLRGMLNSAERGNST